MFTEQNINFIAKYLKSRRLNRVIEEITKILTKPMGNTQR